MKNTHLLPTKSKTRLFLSDYGKILNLASYPETFYTTGQNIYITNDEEIKEGDWFYNTISLKPEPFKACENGNGYVNCIRYSHYRIDCKKIILTTDQDLIKDGVQAVPDDFLEWFVKNPSCEVVEIDVDLKYFNVDELRERHLKGLPYIYSEKIGYKIIIPSEEHKGIELSNQEVMDSRSNAYDFIDVDKQDTLEEIAERLYPENIIKLGNTTSYDASLIKRKDFTEGAKWQQEKSYSEEEVKQAFKVGFSIGYGSDIYAIDEKNRTCEEWFEQFKKK